jgi:4-hydroxybenzoate polyprenyltransferase
MTLLLREYVAERFPLALVFFVPVLLALAAQTGLADPRASFPADCLLALLLFAQLRILDDLADRSRDARVHPERALVRATSVRPVVIVWLALAATTLGALLLRTSHETGTIFSWPSLAGAIVVYLAVTILLSAWYVFRGNRTVLGDHLLLTKYPACVWIIATSRAEQSPPASSSAGQLVLAMFAVYLAACLYEALHDDRSPARTRPGLVLGEGVLLAMTLAVISIRGTA